MPRASRGLAIGLILALTLEPLSAIAAEMLSVRLKNGAKYQGELVESVPNDHVTIKLATGEVKRFAWDELEPEPAEAPKPPAPPAPPTPPPAPTPPAPAGPVVTLGPDKTLVLERETGSSEGFVNGRYARVNHYEVVCHAPCNVQVPSGSGYRVTGPGLRATSTFTLEGSKGNIDARLGKQSGMVGGGVLLALGGAGFLTGAVFLGAADDLSGSSTATTGYALIGLGTALFVIGVVLLATNSNTVTLNGKKLATARPAVALGARGLEF